MFLLGSHQSSPAGQLTLYHSDLTIWNNQIFIHSTHTIVSNKTIPKQSCGIQNKHVTLQWRYQKQKYWNSIHLSDLFIENNPKLLAPTIDMVIIYTRSDQSIHGQKVLVFHMKVWTWNFVKASVRKAHSWVPSAVADFQESPKAFWYSSRTFMKSIIWTSESHKGATKKCSILIIDKDCSVSYWVS